MEQPAETPGQREPGVRRHARKPARTQYAWSGLQMVGETSDSHPDAAVQYIYTENSYEPLARVDSHGEHADIFWYHTELNGLPDSVTDSNGETVWRGASTAWGRSLRESTPVTWDTPQNLRFQGQYLDRETGLHYNTFRYYDPAGGCYTQMDPIGLAGGLNTYTYVVDPLGWVDPLGLRKSCSGFSSADAAAKAALNKYNPMSIFKNREYGGIIYRTKEGYYGYTRARLGKGRTAPSMKASLNRMPKDSTVVGQYHTHGDYSDVNFNRTTQEYDHWDSDSFSLQDINIHTGLGRQHPTYDSSYLGTPSGTYKVMGNKSISVSELP